MGCGNSRPQKAASPASTRDQIHLGQSTQQAAPSPDAVDQKGNGACSSGDEVRDSHIAEGQQDPESRDPDVQSDAERLPDQNSTLIYTDEAADAMRHFIDCALLLPALVPHRVVPLTVAERVVGPFLPGAAVEVQDCIEAAAWVTSIPYGLQVPNHVLRDFDAGASKLAAKVSLTRVLIDHAVNLRDITYEDLTDGRFLATQNEMIDIIEATAPRLESIGAFACVPELLTPFVANGGGASVRALHPSCRLIGETGPIVAQRCRATIESVESTGSPDFLLELFREPTPRLRRFSWGVLDFPGRVRTAENGVVEALLAAARAGFFPLLSDVRLTSLSSQPSGAESKGMPWYDDVMSAIRAQNAAGVSATMTEDQSIFQADTSVVFKLQPASQS